MSDSSGDAFGAFIEKWRQSAAAERANKDSFLNDLCAVLGVPAPNPTTGNAKRDDYVFEKAVVVAGESGKTTKFIDLYKRGSFVLEAKQGSASSTGKLGTAKRDTPTWNVAMNAAFGQAIGYATALDEAPPFVVVTDIGYCFDVYASFDGTPRYRPFPNALDHRFYITRLAERADTLRKIFLEPLSLDPSKVAVEVTREVAVHLANLTKRLERAGHAPQLVADFLMRCIFTMFAEDVGLLPEEVFTKALKDFWIPSPRSFPGGIEGLWRAMNEGSAFGFFGKLLHFNGGLFKSPEALPLDREDLEFLLTAAKCNWNKVEPAIFGALFEGALDKQVRHQLSAHFTPRPYVERLVRPTIEEPVRADWTATQSRIRALASSNKIKDAKAETRAFMRRLSDIRVLDPACGSGNFLYVALDLLKSVEDEAFALLLALEGGQTELCLDAPEVTPKQFRGIETNPRAKAIAELVLWIGYLQWHFRTKHRGGKPREPVLEDYKNIENRDAVLAADAEELVRDERNGKPVTRWDGETMKRHPATGELVPDERFTKLVYRYPAPRSAAWPPADFVVGNPPFIGNKRMRLVLGDGYVDALRSAHKEVPESADFVMYWWSHAAQLLRSGSLQRFGFITTNSIGQSQGRRVIEAEMQQQAPLRLAFAVPDHPWVDTKTGAAVRIAMTVADLQAEPGLLVAVTGERPTAAGDMEVDVAIRSGKVNADLSIGSDTTAAKPLRANAALSFMGVTLVGEGFRLDRSDLQELGVHPAQLPQCVRPYRSGRELTQQAIERWVIDFFGFDEAAARRQFPGLYQWLYDRVRPERLAKAANNKDAAAYAAKWWLFAKPRPDMRTALRGLPRYVATLETSKHRVFVFLEGSTLPDHSLYAVASEDAFVLGVLSSRIHATWAAVAGSTLEDRPRWRNGTCFEPFPFPEPSTEQKDRIRSIAEQIDAHRKQQQAQHATVTITLLYNVLAKLRAGLPLSAAERAVHAHGLVSVLRDLHDELDAEVFGAYGWSTDLTDEQVMGRLVALNAERTEEERRGTVRWLRPDYHRAQPDATIEDTDVKAPTGPGVRKSAPPKGPGVAAARSPQATPKARRKSGGKR